MSTNPLLANIQIPGETVRLPSMGIFYKSDEIIGTNGEVHVHPMSAVDEIVMRSVDKLINGDSIVEVFTRCIPAITKPSELFAKDVDLLLLVLRKVTHGPQLDVQYKHNCENAEEHTYNILLDDLISNTISIDPTKVNEQYTVVVDSGQVVKLNPIRFKDIVKLMQETSINKEATPMQKQTSMINSTISIIASVDGVTDRNHIAEWAKTIPSKWFKKISDAIDASSDWGPSTNHTTICKDCKTEISFDIELNPLTFFL
jgi:hypothetical protein